MPSKDELKLLQHLPLDLKIAKTKLRIREWVNHYGTDGVYVSFSGGKDSTVLLHIVRQMYPDIEAVFVNTGLEYPEIQSFVKSFDNVTILRPKMRFDEVIRKYGYPFISKEAAKTIHYAREGKEWAIKKMYSQHNEQKSIYNTEHYSPLLTVDFLLSSYCCDINKKLPIHNFEKQTGKFAMTGQTADESHLREKQWLKYGCNAFNAKHQISNPCGFWTDQDFLKYIKQNNLPIVSVYGEVVYKARDGNVYENTLCDIVDCRMCTTGCERTG